MVEVNHQNILNTRIKPFPAKFDLDFQKRNQKNCVKLTSCSNIDRIMCNMCVCVCVCVCLGEGERGGGHASIITK